MRAQKLYNLSVRESLSRESSSRIGLQRQRTGVPVFLLFLTKIDKPQSFELFSPEDAKIRLQESNSEMDRLAWQSVLGFFHAGGEHVHLICEPLSLNDFTLSELIGKNIGIEKRTGIHAIRNKVEFCDLIAVPQLSTLLDKKQHEVFYQSLFSLVSEIEHFFILMDFPVSLSLTQTIKLLKKYRSPDACAIFPWVMQGGHKLPPSVILAAQIQKCDKKKGIFHSPANHTLRQDIRPIVRLTPSEAQEASFHNLNLLHYFGRDLVRIWGSTTLDPSRTSQQTQISTRRTLIAIREAIHEICEPFVLETADSDLCRRVDVSIHSFFQSNESLLDTRAKKPFSLDVQLSNESQPKGVVINLELSLPYVLEKVQMTLDLSEAS